MKPGATPSVAVRAFRSVLWSYTSLVGVRLLVLVWTAVLAHVLSPRDFGLVALALIFTTVLDAMRDFGVNDALVVANESQVAHQASTAFCFTVVIATGIAALIVALSPLAGDFFHQPRLAGILAVLALNLPLRAAGDTHYALAQRRLEFRSRTFAEVAEVVVRGIVGVSLALAGLGPWSLVVGYLSGTLVWTISLWCIVSWHPALRLVRASLAPLLRFGGGLTVVGIVGTAMSYVDNLFVGRTLGAAALGLYSMGFRLPEMLISDGLTALALVLFPSFAMLDRAAVRRAVVTSFRYALLVTCPIVAGLVALAHPLVLAVLGPKWQDAVSVVQILALGFIGGPLARTTASAYMATRRVGVMLALAVPQGLLLVGLLTIFTSHGIAAVAGCQAAVRLAFVPIGAYVATRVLGVALKDLCSAAWAPLLAGAIAMLAMGAIEHAVTEPWPALVCGGLVGGTLYLLLVRLLAGDAVSSLSALVRSAWAARRTPNAAVAATTGNSVEGV